MMNLTKAETAMEEWEMAGTKPKILIVDDEPVVCDLLT